MTMRPVLDRGGRECISGCNLATLCRICAFYGFVIGRCENADLRCTIALVREYARSGGVLSSRYKFVDNQNQKKRHRTLAVRKGSPCAFQWYSCEILIHFLEKATAI